ncbi:ankyrin repeat-containing domain, PGG domain protein [Tanacetum coccineum]
MTPTENKLVDLINSDGSTLLHIAAIGGNTEAVTPLVERNPELLLATDKEGHIPLVLSVSNMHIKTSKCLFEYMKEKEYNAPLLGKSGEELVVLAISCQDFSLAKKILMKDFRDAILSYSDADLTTLAQNFPRELNFWERRGWEKELDRLKERLLNYFDWPCGRQLLDYFFFGMLSDDWS